MNLAAVIHAAKDLRVEHVALAPPGPGQVAVRVGAGGICGSDLHYYHDGGFGVVRVREPMVLGHEIAGTIAALGEGVSGLAVGQTVAVNPSLPCNACRYCLAGLQMHCLDMRFYGSAMRFPHVQGGFRQTLVCEAQQAVPVPDGVSVSEAAFGEPLAVCLHAVNRAGPMVGRRVLITGAGPIGVLTALAARRAGASFICVTDLVDEPLALAKQVAADATINVGASPEGLKAFEADKGSFDVMFECSGNQRALAGAFAAVKPRGIIVQIGVGGEFTIPMNVVVAKEFDLRGTFRFHEEFRTAVDFIAGRLIDVRPLLTETVPLQEALRGFELASDRRRAMKVQLSFA